MTVKRPQKRKRKRWGDVKGEGKNERNSVVEKPKEIKTRVEPKDKPIRKAVGVLRIYSVGTALC